MLAEETAETAVGLLVLRDRLEGPDFSRAAAKGMINIVLADDHTIVRKALLALLQCEADFQIIGEAADGLKAMALIDDLKPDVAVLDLMMPGLNGLEVTSQAAQKCPKTKVIILSMLSNEAYIREAMRDGAKGYVVKDSSAEELITAVREVSAGRTYLGSALSEEAISDHELSAAEPLKQLTQRENEIMHLAVAGKSNADIASFLSISQRTVETHCTTLMRKLGVANRHGLVHYAIQKGIISSRDIIGESQSPTLNSKS
jgi:two-component system, NarL family, response regulator NreC